MSATFHFLNSWRREEEFCEYTYYTTLDWTATVFVGTATFGSMRKMGIIDEEESLDDTFSASALDSVRSFIIWSCFESEEE